MGGLESTQGQAWVTRLGISSHDTHLVSRSMILSSSL